jgi:nitrate reductase NapE component
MRVPIERKRRLAAGLVLFLVLWPALHHGLVRSYGIDPWRFLGWSMYAAPNAQVRLGLRGFVGGRELQFGVGAKAREAGNRYARWRANVGEFASARPLAAAAFEEHPDLDAVDVVIYTRVLDRESARFETVESRLHFERD